MTKEERRLRNNEAAKRWRVRHPERRRASIRRYYENNRDKLLAKDKIWKQSNREKHLQYVKNYQARNKILVAKRSKDYRSRNKDKVKRWQSEWQKRKRLEDLSFKVLRTLRCRIHQALKKRRTSKVSKTSEMLGCSIPDFILYLESKWELGMSWENYGVGIGKWGVDHIMPCAIFDFTKPEHQLRCFHFSNQQPMWNVDNSVKGKRVITDQFNLL